jgi:hypothetical protein
MSFMEGAQDPAHAPAGGGLVAWGISGERVRWAAFHAGWMVILLAAVWKRFALPLSPVAEGDLSGFLDPAISLLTGHGFQPNSGQPFLYPGLLAAVLGVFQDFRAIAIVSRLLGLGGGLLLLASWRSAGALLAPRRISPWLYDAMGLAMFAIALFAPMPAQLEYAIRADSICPFFAALSIFCVARFLLSRKSAGAAKRGWMVWGAAALFTGFFLPVLKPSFWLSGMFSTIPIWVALFDRREKWAHRALMAGTALAAIFLLLFLPGRHFARMDSMNLSFFPESIFSIHAVIIREQIAADLEQGNAVPYAREDLESTLALLDAGIRASPSADPRGFGSPGYDADRLLHHDAFFSKMEERHGFLWPLGFYRYYFWRTWEQRPGAMAAKVIHQLRLFYNFDCPAYRGRRIRLQNMYRESIKKLSEPHEQALLGQWPPAAHLLDTQARDAARAPEIRTPWLLDRILNALAASYFPSFLLFLAALPWALGDKTRRARYGSLVALLAVAYGYNVGNNLGIAIFHTLQVNRYSLVQFGTTLFSQMLCLMFLAECVVGRRFERRNERIF